MRGVPRERPAISAEPSSVSVDAQQVGAAGQDQLELGGLVELHLPDEAEPVAQRPGQQARPGGGADQRERVDLQGDRRGTGALADDHVDAEVLHRHVEELFGRTGDAVDLVDEQHVTVAEVRQHGGEIAGALDRRTAGDLDRRPELRPDDQRQRRLAQPRRAGQQHVVRRPPAALGALEHQVQLPRDLLLADEVGQRVRPQRRLDDPLLVPGLRGHRVLPAEAADRLAQQRAVEGRAHSSTAASAAPAAAAPPRRSGRPRSAARPPPARGRPPRSRPPGCSSPAP